jgi:hypothetical protein
MPMPLMDWSTGLSGTPIQLRSVTAKGSKAFDDQFPRTSSTKRGHTSAPLRSLLSRCLHSGSGHQECWFAKFAECAEKTFATSFDVSFPKSEQVFFGSFNN